MRAIEACHVGPSANWTIHDRLSCLQNSASCSCDGMSACCDRHSHWHPHRQTQLQRTQAVICGELSSKAVKLASGRMSKRTVLSLRFLGSLGNTNAPRPSRRRISHAGQGPLASLDLAICLVTRLAEPPDHCHRASSRRMSPAALAIMP